MSVHLDRLLEQIEADMAPEVGQRFVDVAASYFEQSREPDRPVSTQLGPEELKARFDEPFSTGPAAVSAIVERVQRDVVQQSNWLYHPRYMGHQVSAPLPVAVWADVIVSALNQSLAVQEMSPALTMVEDQLIRWCCGLVGFWQGAGTLTSGGTEATFTALLAARAAALPNAWTDGLEGNLPVVLCGEHAHYAVTRAVAQLGLGLKRAISVAALNDRMDVADLRAKLVELKRTGVPVLAVVATAGSTPTGSFDDLNAIADLCDESEVWLHVDGAHGASALLSEAHKNSVSGIERARSVAWDPHKMMLMPLSVGVLMMRSPADLDAAFQQAAPYLFHGGGAQRSWDQGGRSFQCSRRADALKLWVAIRRYGTEAFGVLYDHFAELATYLHEILTNHPDFEPLHEPECNILCFRCIRGDTADLDEINLRLRTSYNRAGTGWITTTVLDGKRVLRVTLINPRLRREHLDAMVAELSELAHI